MPLPPAASLTHASALASQFYEYQNLNAAAAASLATYPGSAAYPVDPYPYTSAAAAAAGNVIFLFILSINTVNMSIFEHLLGVIPSLGDHVEDALLSR